MSSFLILLKANIRVLELLKAHLFRLFLHSFVYIHYGLAIVTYAVCVISCIIYCLLSEFSICYIFPLTLHWLFFLYLAIAVLWIEFVREIRFCWEESQPLPKMLANSSIDLATCLINQKLQMVIYSNDHYWIAVEYV